MKTIILVDEYDNEIGTSEKIAAHEKALCHRAFSIFLFRKHNNSWQVLLQQRHPDKYHCGGLWTNTCCSHPAPGETTIAAGKRRLFEEMRINTKLKEAGVFHYIAKFDNGLTENEVDHVLVGFYDSDKIDVDKTEISNYNWVKLSDLESSLSSENEIYTPWFERAYNIARNYLMKES